MICVVTVLLLLSAATRGQATCDGCDHLNEITDQIEWTEHCVTPNAEHKLEFCAMGMKNGKINDSAIHASSDFDHTLHHHRHGRLDQHVSIESVGAWCAQSNVPGEWIEIDFGKPRHVAGVVTQGRASYNQWVTSYKVGCGHTDRCFTFITEKGHDKTFAGNTDSDTHVAHQFPHVVTCRYVRIFPMTWNNHISMRVELLDGMCFGDMKPLLIDEHEKIEFCGMGMKNGDIHDDAIAASSDWDETLHHHRHGRLDQPADASSVGAWAAKNNDDTQWIQVDFGSDVKLSGVITQGRASFDQWVTSYKIGYGHTPDSLHIITDGGEEKVFHGNTDSDSKVYHRFPLVVSGRYVRLFPVTWHNHISLRLEYIHGKCYPL